MKDLQGDSKEEIWCTLQGCNHLAETTEASNATEVIKDTFKVALDIYTLTQG
jgi:hypothetical protein